MEYKLEAACASDIGKRRGNNEDNFFFDNLCMPADHRGTHDPLYLAQPIKRGLCLAVFDGMGGENYGELASFAAAQKLKEIIETPQEFYLNEKSRLLSICEKLNLAVVEKAEELMTSRMGTTMAALYFTHNKVYCCNVGDSRVYRLRDSVFQQLSVDHVSQRPMPGNRKPPLTQHLGMNPEEVRMEPFIAKGEIAGGDWYLICSDGLTDMVSNLEITQILQSGNDVEKTVDLLVQSALEHGGRDNVTVILCKILPTDAQEQDAEDRQSCGEPIPETLYGSRESEEADLEFLEDPGACRPGQKKDNPEENSPAAAPAEPGKNAKKIPGALGTPQERWADDSRHSDTEKGNTYPQAVTSPGKPPVHNPCPSQAPYFPKLIILSIAMAVIAAAVILGVVFAIYRQNNQKELLPAVSYAANTSLPDAAAEPTNHLSEVPATQSGVLRDRPNRIKVYAVEEDHFWGQNQITRQEITKIVFTNEPITGTYSWDVSEAEDGSIMACVDNGILYVTSDEAILLNSDSSGLFARFGSAREIAFNTVVDTSEVKNMVGMFYGCSSLTSLDVFGFDTANVTNMGGTFYGCSSLTSLDVSCFNSANVTNMSCMFYGCSGLTSLNVSGINTANVTNMGGTFYGCSGLTSLDVSGFDTANVTNMSCMFYGCSSLTSLDVSGFNTTNVTDMIGMFYGCSNLANLGISGWDTSKANTSDMFTGTPLGGQRSF